MNETVYEYYRQQDILPTEGGLETLEELAAHEQERRRLFTDKLALPPSLFRGARLLEFGPDAGGNSVVFAKWGAECTLAEPNPKAHARITNSFERFGLTDRLVALLAHDVDTFPEDRRFDVVDAEGFIYTVQPPSRWLAKFAALTVPEGFAVVTYYEPAGAFFELLWKVVHARYCALTGLSGLTAAEAVFRAKWNSIPHLRTLESWTMDVLENPFVRLQHFLDPRELLGVALACGFALHASWPRYRSGFEVGWFKRPVAPELELDQERTFVGCSRISYLFGRSHFVSRPDPALEREVLELVAALDRLVDGIEPGALARCRAGLAVVDAALGSDAVVSTADDVARSRAAIAMLQRLLDLLEADAPERLASFCAEEEAFVGSWGAPNHFAVLRRLSTR